MSDALIQAFELMGFGMGGVFFVLFLIYLVCIALNHIFSTKNSKKAGNSNG